MYRAKIILIRNARGYSQEYMAKKLDIEQPVYSKIERNEKKADDAMIQKIAEVLGVSADDIKSFTPIVMSFNNSPHSNGIYGTQHNYTNDKLIEQLIHQLKIKDDQIAKLLPK